MLTIKEWMELIDYRITEGSIYGWQCYGHNAYTMDSWNGDHSGYSLSINFDTRTQEVYEVSVHDFLNSRAYRMINPAYVDAFTAEFKARGIQDEAWEDDNGNSVKWIDLEVDDDFIQKALAIKAGEDYDTSVSVPIDFSDAELLKYMTLAHERNITFNQLVEEALRDALDEFKRDPDSMVAKAQQWKKDHDLT